MEQVIEVLNLKKNFRAPLGNLQGLAKIWRYFVPRYKEQEAIRGISFSIKKAKESHLLVLMVQANQQQLKS